MDLQCVNSERPAPSYLRAFLVKKISTMTCTLAGGHEDFDAEADCPQDFCRVYLKYDLIFISIGTGQIARLPII